MSSPDPVQILQECGSRFQGWGGGTGTRNRNHIFSIRNCSSKLASLENKVHFAELLNVPASHTARAQQRLGQQPYDPKSLTSWRPACKDTFGSQPIHQTPFHLGFIYLTQITVRPPIWVFPRWEFSHWGPCSSTAGVPSGLFLLRNLYAQHLTRHPCAMLSVTQRDAGLPQP